MLGGFTSMASAGIGHGLGGDAIFGSKIATALGHGVAQGAIAEIRGGKFRSGFVGGVVGHVSGYAMGSVDKYHGAAAVIGRTTMAAVAGGLTAEATGGSFADGAFHAAMVHLFNKEASRFAALKSRQYFYKRYWRILQAGNINIDQNVIDAKAMSFLEWKKAVQTGGKWDYKNNTDIKGLLKVSGNGVTPSLLDEFGNFHFGIVAGAHGFNLATSLFGAGTNQVFIQGGGSLWNWGNAPFLASNGQARFYTYAGWTWGDNPGDAINIMHGWEYYHANY